MLSSLSVISCSYSADATAVYTYVCQYFEYCGLSSLIYLLAFGYLFILFFRTILIIYNLNYSFIRCDIEYIAKSQIMSPFFP